MSCEVKSCMFVRNKSIIRYLNFKPLVLAKIPIHNITFSSEKVHPLLFSHIKICWHICLELFLTVFACKWCFICAYFSPDSDKATSWWICFLQTHSFLIHTMLNDRLQSCGLFVNYWDVFISPIGLWFWRHLFTAEDPMVSKWCNDKFLKILRAEGV